MANDGPFDLELFKERDRLIYVLWRRANLLRTVILKEEIAREIAALNIAPITDEEIKASEEWLKSLGINLERKIYPLDYRDNQEG